MISRRPTEERGEHTGPKVAACGRQHMGIDEQRLRRVHLPRLARASRECEDLRIDEIAVYDRIPHGLLHCTWRTELCLELYAGHRLFRLFNLLGLAE